jgi:hypothetical protein
MTDQTRRNWLITITQAGIASRVKAGEGLPPGVYQPSTEHLSHALMSADRYRICPPGCPTEYNLPPEAFQPLFFSAGESAIIRRLVQLLLGENSDQSEIVHEIAEWINLRVLSLVEARAVQLQPLHRALAIACRTNSPIADGPDRISRQGLAWLVTHHFMSLGLEDQTALLHSISDEQTSTPASAGTLFFAFLKTEIIKAFYTSRTGLKELDFKGNAFYARSPGCAS